MVYLTPALDCRVSFAAMADAFLDSHCRIHADEILSTGSLVESGFFLS